MLTLQDRPGKTGEFDTSAMAKWLTRAKMRNPTHDVDPIICSATSGHRLPRLICRGREPNPLQAVHGSLNREKEIENEDEVFDRRSSPRMALLRELQLAPLPVQSLMARLALRWAPVSGRSLGALPMTLARASGATSLNARFRPIATNRKFASALIYLQAA